MKIIDLSKITGINWNSESRIFNLIVSYKNIILPDSGMKLSDIK